MRDVAERYLGLDPGRERLRSASNAVTAWLAAVGVAALLESLTHGFEISASTPDASAVNHVLRLIVLMLGSTVALTASFVVADGTARARALTSLLAASGLWAGFALAVAVHGSRVLSLVLLVLVPAAGAWFRRFGPRGFATSFTVHVGYVVGFLVAPKIGLGRLGWVAAVIGCSAVATYVVGLGFVSGHRRAAERMTGSYRSRARRVLTSGAALLDMPAGSPTARRTSERLRRQVVRLNETALVLDVQLAGIDDEAAHARAERRRRDLFNHERAVVMLARLARRHADADEQPAAHDYGRAVLVAARDSDIAALQALTREGPGRGAEASSDLVDRYRDAASLIVSVTNSSQSAVAEQQPSEGPANAEDVLRNVNLVGGWLPGTAIANATVSPHRGTRLGSFGLSVSNRVALQLAVALALAVTFADLISPPHVLWAVIAVYVTFLGSGSDREQLRKAGFRVAGTVAGVLVGGEVAHLTSPHIAATIVAMSAAVFFMAYFGRIHYALVVFAATLGVTQFYAQVGELTNAVLVSRVEVTAVGAACAVAVSLTVLPLRTVHAAAHALSTYCRALAHALDTLTAAPQDARPTANLRVLDATFHTADATIRPLTRTLLGTAEPRCSRVLRIVDITHDLSTALMHDATIPAIRSNAPTVDTMSRRTAALARLIADDLEHKSVGMRRSPASLTRTIDGGATSDSREVRTELEGLNDALTELAKMRHLADPETVTIGHS